MNFVDIRKRIKSPIAVTSKSSKVYNKMKAILYNLVSYKLDDK